MKVLHVIPSVSERSGGPGQAIIPMCRALQGQGTDVFLATTDSGLDSKQVTFTAPTLYKGIPTVFFPAQWGESFKYSRPLAVWLDANVKRFDLVHIHAVFNHACIAAARTCRKHRVPYIVRPLGTLDPWSMKQKPLRKSLFWQVAGKRMLRDAAAVHYTARAEQQAVEESLGLNHGKVVPLGVETTVAESAESDDIFTREFPALVGRPYVLMLSRLLPTKGIDVLLDSFLSLVERREFANWRLVLAGEGPRDYFEALRRKVEARNAWEKVLFSGWLESEKKTAILNHASLLALPSYHENFGLCVMEAMACGVPVLISPHVNLAPEIEAAGAGWVASVDKDSMKAALADALTSTEERLRRGQAGEELSLRFAWPAIASQLTDLYRSCLKPANVVQYQSL